MTWARFIATVESELPAMRFESVTFQVDTFRQLLLRGYTEGFSEGLKRGRKEEDTHVLIKYLNQPNS